MSNEQTRAVLLRAAEILEPEGAWIQGDYAQDREGISVQTGDPEAVCWCMEGALWKAEQEIWGAINPSYADPYDLLQQVIDSHPDLEITSWNDSPERTQAEVVQALRAAAATVPA